MLKAKRMIHIDFTWDLSRDGILLDEELNIDKLGWKGGDYFKIVNINGRVWLKKVDDLEKFLASGVQNVQTR